MEREPHTNRATEHHPTRLTGVASAYIEPYLTPGGTKVGPDGKTKKPQKRYRVRARAGKSGAALLHLGSFATKGEANIRLKWASDLLAAGVRPRLDMLFAEEAAPNLTVTAAVERYLDQRPDLTETTRRTYRSLTPHIVKALGPRDIYSLTPDDVRELVRVTAAAVGPDATRTIKGILAKTLENAGVRPNPARDGTVKLPKRTVTNFAVPPAAHVEAVHRGVPEEMRLVVMLLEATGARISEMLGVQHGDVDHAAGKIRINGKGGKIRLVPLPPELGALMPRVAAADRNAAGKVWPGLTADRVRKAMAKACDAAVIPRYAPHSLRRRFASRHVQIGTPINQLSALLGHSKTSLTHDVYAKVLMDGDTAEAWRSVIH